MKNTTSTKKEYSNRETVTVMETVLFTDITETNIKKECALVYYDYLDFIATENKYKAKFTPLLFLGNSKEINKTFNKFFESIKYN